MLAGRRLILCVLVSYTGKQTFTNIDVAVIIANVITTENSLRYWLKCWLLNVCLVNWLFGYVVCLLIADLPNFLFARFVSLLVIWLVG